MARVIPECELKFSFARSAGPGGQNVNKVNTKMILKWDIRASAELPQPIKNLLLERLSKHLTGRGVLVISSMSSRSQRRNREECLRKLYRLVEEALRRRKVRRSTTPTAEAEKRRLCDKKKRAYIKALRKRNVDEEC